MNRSSDLREIWKPIITNREDYTGRYEISNLGRVKSLPRKTSNQFAHKERILKPTLNTYGYPVISLCRNARKISYHVHLLVWDSFTNEKRNTNTQEVDHIDNDKTNSSLSNLRLISKRENSSKAKLISKPNNLPTGVFLENGKYRAVITKNKKKIHLGYYDSPQEAEKVYQEELRRIDCQGK